MATHHPAISLTRIDPSLVVAGKIPAGRRVSLQAKIFSIVGLLAAVTLLATAIGVSSMSSYHEQVAAMARASERGLLGEELDKLVTAVVMDSRGIYMSTNKAEVKKFAPSLLQSLANLQPKSLHWSALAPEARRETMTDAAGKVEDFVRFRKELVRLARDVSLVEARAFGDNDENSANRSQLYKSLTSLVDEDSLRLIEIRNDIEAFYWHRLQLLIGLCPVGLLVGGMIAIFVVRWSAAKPLSSMVSAVSAIAAGNLQVDVPVLYQRNEIGQLGKAIQVFKDNALLLQRMESGPSELKRKTEEERRATMHQVADGFEAAIGKIVQTVSATASEIEVASGSLAKTAECTQELLGTVAAASEQSSGNVQSAAAAAEEIAASVREIGRQVKASHGVAHLAVQQAEQTNARINELNGSAGRIGEVVKMISAVADQTNLLALNATIEAARAGDAGRGFAVVASEVKALAAQTAKATEEIGVQITQMQSATKHSVLAIKEIGSTINHISEISTAIAAAVEEQGSATQEIARSVQHASQGASQVAGSIADVNRAAADTSSESGEVHGFARTLLNESEHLKLEVEKFLTTVRAA